MTWFKPPKIVLPAFLKGTPGKALPVDTEVVPATSDRVQEARRVDPGLVLFWLTPMYRLAEHHGLFISVDLVEQFRCEHQAETGNLDRRLLRLSEPFATLPTGCVTDGVEVLEALPADAGIRFAEWLAVAVFRIVDPNDSTGSVFYTQVVKQRTYDRLSGKPFDVFVALPQCSGRRVVLTGEPGSLRVVRALKQ
jgi:hypothetical protein